MSTATLPQSRDHDSAEFARAVAEAIGALAQARLAPPRPAPPSPLRQTATPPVPVEGAGEWLVREAIVADLRTRRLPVADTHTG